MFRGEALGEVRLGLGLCEEGEQLQDSRVWVRTGLVMRKVTGRE